MFPLQVIITYQLEIELFSSFPLSSVQRGASASSTVVVTRYSVHASQRAREDMGCDMVFIFIHL